MSSVLKTPARRSGRRLFRLVAALLGAASAWACGPVYIPVPPPMQTQFTSELLVDESGATRQFWIAAGGPDSHAASATFYVFDQERNAGVIAGAMVDGSYTAPAMEGAEGDRILIYYRDNRGRSSGVACLRLSEQLPPPLCP